MDLFLLTGRNSHSDFRNIFTSNDLEDVEISEKQQRLSVYEKIFKVLHFLVHLAIMFIAGKLSWDCNGNYPTYLRVIYTFFAAMFGFTYIILYGIFRSDLCKKIKS